MYRFPFSVVVMLASNMKRPASICKRAAHFMPAGVFQSQALKHARDCEQAYVALMELAFLDNIYKPWSEE